jgi:predicted dehydrogenase
MQNVSVGVVGYGYWGPNLARNLHEDDRVELRYICDRAVNMLEKHRRRYQTTTFTSDYDDLLKDKTLTAIVIATPASTHFELAKKALAAGKHVLMEKPMCETSDQCRELIEMAESRQLTLMVDHTFVYHGPVRLIKQLMDGGELGDILYFNSLRINLGIFQQDCNVIWDLGTHDLSIMDYLIGKTPISVHAIGASHTDSGMEDIAFMTIKFADDIIAHFQCSWLSPVKLRQIMIGGSRKMLVFDDASQVEKIKLYDKGIDTMNVPQTDQERYKTLVQYRYGDMRAPVYDVTEALRVECRHFLDCILQKQKPITDGNSGLRVVRLLELAQTSLKTGLPVAVTSLEFA